ncbi:MAG: hypothetical protein ACTHJU_09350 [Sphingopyxis sp.]
MAPVGVYWREGFRSHEALYSPADDLVYVAYHFDEAAHQGDYYSEFDDPCLEEIRLLAALMLPIGWDGGIVSLYPHGWELSIPEMLDLASADVDQEIRSRVVDADYRCDLYSHTDPPPPPLNGGPSYNFRDSSTPVQLQHQIFTAIKTDDHLLLRGLGAWVKAGMLRHHRHFGIEALYSMYVALDASFSLVCRQLRERGNSNPSAVDAGRFLDEAEGRAVGNSAYFGDFYADRIQLLHPENRFGTTPYPPAMYDDLFHLNWAMREVYRLLLIGTIVDPKNYPSVSG